MARADLILNLVRAATDGDRRLLLRTVETLAAEEREKQHSLLADRLLDLVRQEDLQVKPPTALRPSAGVPLIETKPDRRLGEIMLPPHVYGVVGELVEEQHRRELLNSYNLEPRHKIMLVGPPGNGKTSLANAIATSLLAPMYTVRYESLIGSYLGETATALERVFEFVRTRRCVVFFDEFDTLAKERGDIHETGEIKRVVSSLLLQVDALPSYVVVVVATNHEELLDRAAWRRFEIIFNIPPPTKTQVIRWLDAFREEIGGFAMSTRTLAERLQPTNYSELELFCTNVMRRLALHVEELNAGDAIKRELASWRHSRFART